VKRFGFPSYKSRVTSHALPFLRSGQRRASRG